jgi:hypothetical protein
MKQSMLLKFIERDTAMKIQVIINGESVGEAYAALFYDLDTDTSFFARCQELHDSFSELTPDAHLKVTFWLRENMYMFEGIPIELAPYMGSNSVLIKQTTDIDAMSLRRDARNEMSIPVSLYVPSPDWTPSSPFRVLSDTPVFTANTFDISVSGLCLVSNDYLEIEYPLLISEFSLYGKKTFLLPVKFMRMGDCPQTVLYHYDYGFLFVFDDCPDERSRLSAAITDTVFRTKLSGIRRWK